MLHDIENKSLLQENHLYLLNPQPDGSFKIAAVNGMVLQCHKDNRLFSQEDTSECDGYQFWRRERNFIVSKKSHGCLGADCHNDTLLSVHYDGADDAQKYIDECAVEKVVRFFPCINLCIPIPNITQDLT